MNIDHRNPRLRRGFAFVALAAVLGLSAVGLTQCRMVDDTVTGVNLQTSTDFNSGRSKCVHQCDAKYKACRKTEDARHKAAVRNCGHDHACKKAEEKLHQQNLKDCVRQMQLCKKSCRYHEGAGSAGR